MKVAPANINNTINQLPPITRVVLLYGPDYGLVEERAKILKNNFLGESYEDSQYIQLYESQIKENPNIILENAYIVALFGENKKCIVIAEAKDFLTKKIDEYLQKTDADTLLIIKAQELSPSSSLRKLCENASNEVLAIPCYVDNAISLRQNILDKLKKEAITIDNTALTALTSLLGNDRGITNTEIEKLIVYAYDKKNINLTDVEELIADNSLAAIDKFIYALFDLNTSLAYSMIDNLLEENNPVVIVRSIISHTQKLLLAKILMEEKNMNVEMALKEIRPPIFFSYVNSFKVQIDIWRAESLKNLLNKLIYLEIDLKINSNVDKLLLKDIILKRFTKK
ncbi:MAG: DNA polymerase III subunit delta [Alphaproteobacteria bacterium]|jgi:DNA polymerase-3 subunit delta|nr:DNA polymerase III subunit delta [Alphaproteobacteria bacterium]